MATKTHSVKTAEATPVKRTASKGVIRSQGSLSFQGSVGIESREIMRGFASAWSFNEQHLGSVLRKCRSFYELKENDWVENYVSAKSSVFSSGFQLLNSEGANLFSPYPRYRIQSLISKIWRDYVGCSNVVAVWMDKRIPGQLPVVILLRPDAVRYRCDFGIESLEVKFEKANLSDPQKRGLPPRIAQAIEKGEWLELDRTEGECFAVLSDSRDGGLTMPRLRAVLLDLAIRDLLRIGDWNGAKARTKILRHSKKGHEIKNGELAGRPDHFYKSAFGKKLLKYLADVTGYAELATNFDMLIEYVFLDSKFFDEGIYSSVETRLDQWAGPIMKLMRIKGEPNPELSALLRLEARAERTVMSEFLMQIFSHESFFGKEASKIMWDESIFMSMNLLREWIVSGAGNGILSPQTARDMYGVSDQVESKRMREASDRRDDYTPPFEAKQGIVGTQTNTNDGQENG